MIMCNRPKIKVKLNSSERMEYIGYLFKIETSDTIIEVETYFRRAKNLLDNALVRQGVTM